MRISNLVTEHLVLPISDLLTGYTLSREFRFLSRTQFWTREMLDAYQNKKLRKLISHSFKNVPFYRELFIDLNIKPEEIQTKEDLKRLPIITKEELKRKRNKHKATNINSRDLILSSSSGSTGEPFQFFSTKASESMLKAAVLRARYWMGYKLGNRYVKLSMNPRGNFVKKIQDKLNNSLYLSSQQLTEDSFDKIADNLMQFNPVFICGYPVPLMFLSEQIAKKNGHYPNKALISINTSGSTLSEEIREKIERIFNVKIFDSYSCEGGTTFDQCEKLHNYHPAEEYAISEFIEDAYTNIDPDKPLRHITTDLHNYASPFIRYDTQDYVVLNDSKPCNCGRKYINIKKIKGRDGDILKTPSGKYLITENFVAYFEWIPEVDQIQVVQEAREKITIKMKVNESFNNEVKTRIYNYWKEYIGNDVDLAIEQVDHIQLTPSGKRRTIIRHPSISLND